MNKSQTTFSPIEKIKKLKNGSLMIYMDNEKWLMFTKQEADKIKEVLK